MTEELRRLEITEDVLKDGYDIYYKGDIKSFPSSKAAQWISLGWAKDVETGETGERVPGVAPVVPAKVAIKPAIVVD